MKKLQIFHLKGEALICELSFFSEFSIIQQLSSLLYHSYCSLSHAIILIKDKSPIYMTKGAHTALYVYGQQSWNKHRPHKSRDLCHAHKYIYHVLCRLLYCITFLSSLRIYTNRGRYSYHILYLKLLWTSITLLTSTILCSLLLTSQSAATLLSASPCSPLSEGLGSCPRSI